MKVGLLGVDFNSNNRGCGALGYATLKILTDICMEKGESLEAFAVLFATEPSPIVEDDIKLYCYKIRPKKIAFWKECKSIFNKCNIVFDFTGGDSFSDIYGLKRFVLNSMLKELAIRSSAKFIMAPQTIGPFSSRFAKIWAKRIMQKSDYNFVRDTMSAKYTKENFGIETILTTDVAFKLPYQEVSLQSNSKKRIGFNPSGLLWSGMKTFTANRHITVDYNKYVTSIMKFLCAKEDVEVHLIPHVFTRDGMGGENDMRACIEIHEIFPDTIIETEYDTPMELKGLIATMDLFIGARMHATIASFSTGVATIPFSYSRKFEGLYNDLNYPYVISATCMSTDESIEKTIEWINDAETLTYHVADSQKLLVDKQKRFHDVLLSI